MDIRLENLRELLMKEVQCVNDRGELSPELVHPTKDIVETLDKLHEMEMREMGGTSEGNIYVRNHPYDGSYGGSYGGRRDGSYGYNDFRNQRDHNPMMNDLENAMRRATSEADRERIRALMDQMRR